MKPNNKKTSTAAVAAQPQDTSIKWLATFLLIAYGYVTVITPNWMAFDSNATKFYTFAILNLVVVALVFFIKEFREYKNNCNEKHKYKESSKYYLAIVNNTVSIEIENKQTNTFVLLGYFNNLGDCQKAREKYQKKILELNEYGYWD